jgi:hypothetical protein
MPDITVTLVDRTQGTSQDARDNIMSDLESILGDLLFSDSDLTTVNMRWVKTSPDAGDQDLVLHYVQDIASSYLRQNWGAAVQIDPVAGGHTHNKGTTMGSEFYRMVFNPNTGKTTTLRPKEHAILAAHEILHNITNNKNGLHCGGGIAEAKPHLPVTTFDRRTMQDNLGKIPSQLL